MVRRILIGVVVLVVIGGAIYAGNFFTRKFFLEDFNTMNHYYKQALFYTGQDKREEAVTNYTAFVQKYIQFAGKYGTTRPYLLAHDKMLPQDLSHVAALLSGVTGRVESGDLHEAHLMLEKVRPIFQDILKRNGFSLLAVALVDFHDAMEVVIDAADAGDAAKVLAAYPEANTRLAAVEELSHDGDIALIRTKLEEVKTLAETGTSEATASLAAKAAELKSAFVKVYLVRG